MSELRDAAQAVVDLTDDLASWDELNRYVINSERDYLAGNLDAAWERLRAALAAQPESAGPDGERIEAVLRAARTWRGDFDGDGYGVDEHNDYEGHAGALISAIDALDATP